MRSKKMPLANGVFMTFALLLTNKENKNRIKRRDGILMKFIFAIVGKDYARQIRTQNDTINRPNVIFDEILFSVIIRMTGLFLLLAKVDAIFRGHHKAYYIIRQ